MARTYRRCTNKSGNRVPNLDLEKEAARFFTDGFYNRRLDRYYRLWYYTSDRSFVFDSRPLKWHAKKLERTRVRETISKIKSDLDFADEFILHKKYSDPWCWD